MFPLAFLPFVVSLIPCSSMPHIHVSARPLRSISSPLPHPAIFYYHQRPNLSYSVPPPLILFRLPIPSPLLLFTYTLYVESLSSSPLSLSVSYGPAALSFSHIPYLPTFFFFSDIPYQSSVVSFPHFFLSPLSYLHSLFLDYRINSPLTLPVPLPLPRSVNSVPSTPS